MEGTMRRGAERPAAGPVLNGGRGTARGLMRGACQRHMPLYNMLHYNTHYTLLQATDMSTPMN